MAADDDDLEAIRERKRRRLQEGEESSETEGHDDPVHVEGEAHLSELVETHETVLVDFYADWCGPCKALEPTIESIAADTDAVVAKIDIDAHQELAAASNVRGVPTLVLYADGEPVERLVGMQDEARLRSLIAEH